LVAGLGACTSASKGASGGAPTEAGTSPSMTAPSATAASASATSTATGSAAFSDDWLETMRAKVAAVFGQGVTASQPQYFQPTPDPKELAVDFDNPATMKAVWGDGTAVGVTRPMDCGMAKYNGVAIGAVQGSGASASVPVLLYEGQKAGTVEVTMNVDPGSGLITGFSCSAPKAADFPGIAPIATYYGAAADLDEAVLKDKTKSYFTPAFEAWHPADGDYDKKSCSQSVSDFWIVALTGTTSSASTWDFGPEGVKTIADPAAPTAPTGFHASMAVDLGSALISRVTCQSKPPSADSAHPAQYADELMNYYRLAADQTSLGVDAEAAIKPFFVSDTAFTTAWSSTGSVPLLCAKKVPGLAVTATGATPATSGAKTSVAMVTWPGWHPDQPGQELSKFTLTLDASTMKIASITCGE